ncbi:MAG: hypothetical protein KGJ60_00480, partial [Verrucomicrobiota bacterium]|nr:hypothetical protein [Verrucomicrobiota bacterium]
MATNSGPIPLIGGGTPIDTNGLWLTLDAVSNDEAFLTIHGTTNGVEYQVLSRESLNDTNGWQPEGPMVWGGANTNWTPTTAFENGRTNLFFWAQSQIDTTGTGIPDWWWLKYFGTTAGADAYVDPAGDGWNNLEKFQNGMNPNQFYTPPAPQGVTVSYDPATGMATVSWLASPGPVTSYTINFNGVVTNVSAGTTSFTESFANTPSDIANNGPTVYSTFQVQANYAGGSSPQVSTSLESDYPLVGVIAGSSESAYLTAAASTLPADTTAIRLSRIDIYAESYYGDSSFDTNWDIPVSAFANGLYPIPSFMQAAPVDSYGQSDYRWWVQTVTTNGSASSWAGRGGGYGLSPDGSTTWYEPPFYDGRAQLKQDLVFILRAASQNQAFYFQEWNTNYFYAGAGGNTGYFTYDFGNPANYAWASPYNANGESQVDGSQFFSWDPFEPFDDNYRYENFVFNTANVDGSGAMTTGVVDDNGQLELWDPTYQISYPSTVHQTTNAWLTANQTRWLYSEWEVDNSNVISQNFPTYSMSASARNIYGLPFVSTELAYPTSSGLGTTTLSAGSQVTLSSALSYPEIYLETAQPQFQTVEYDFWNPAASSYQTPPNQDLVPGMSGFSVTNKSRLMILPVGQEATIAGYAKLAVTNGYPGVYAYLGQYFDKAYAVDNNGNVTTNQTGILSPYGDFFPTQPGPAALVTMPDVDTGVCGTCRVYCVSLVLDANHDGVMDTSFGGPDATSASSPTIFWANNNYDRFTLDSDGTNYYDDDVAPSSKDAPCPYTSNTPTPDCNYLDGDGHRVISCERDLEDFARLWVCGVTSNLLAALPAGSTVTLNWGDVGSPHSANPTIDIFTAADPDGGIGYLTNSTIASEQDDSLFSPYIGRLGPGGSLQLNASTFTNNWAGNHFIWCGVSNGVGQLNLTIADGSGNVLAQASQWIEIKDIKQMYERWTVGEQPSVAPLTNAEAASEDLAPYTMPFRYTQP